VEVTWQDGPARRAAVATFGVGRARSLGSLGNVAYERFWGARDARQPEAVLLGHLQAALDGYQQALDLFPADDAEDLATVHNQIGNVYRETRNTRRALTGQRRRPLAGPGRVSR
jgi:hypothetical protein